MGLRARLREFIVRTVIDEFFGPEQVAEIVGPGAVPGTSRVRLSNGAEIDVVNATVATAPGLRVRIGYDRTLPGVLQVIGLRVNPIQFKPNWNLFVLSHHESHEFPGNDTVWVNEAQLLPNIVSPGGGMKVDVRSGMYWIGGQWREFSGKKVNLSSYVPGSGARVVLISVYWNNDHVDVAVTEGPSKPHKSLLTPYDIPVPPDGHIPLAGVVLFAGQDRIVRDVRPGKRNDIIDLRWAYWSGDGDGVEEAPEDGKLYGRKDASWKDVEAWLGERPNKSPDGTDYLSVLSGGSAMSVLASAFRTFVLQGHDHTAGEGDPIPQDGIADGAVTEQKLADGAVTGTKMNVGPQSYTPTATIISNLDSVTPQPTTYYTLGRLVVVYGRIAVNPTTTGSISQLSITLPLSLAIPAHIGSIAGVCGSPNHDETGVVYADTTNLQAVLRFNAATGVNHNIVFLFVYTTT